MARQEDTSYPMREGFVDFNELLDKPIKIIDREQRSRKDGGTFDVWLVADNGETLYTIPRGNLAVRHRRWLTDHPGEERKVVISGEQTSSGYMNYKIMLWDDNDEKLWEEMQHGDNVPF